MSLLSNTGLPIPDLYRHDNDLIPSDEMQERELRRALIVMSREVNAEAQAKLFALYGVKISSPPKAK